MRFEFATSGRILFGPGVIKEAGRAAAALGKKALIVHGSRKGPALILLKILEEAGVEGELFGVEGEPELDHTRLITEMINRDRYDLVAAIGGGSVLDAGKAGAGLATQPGDVLDYLEVIGSGKVLENTPLPFIAIPTTSGTGSEVTRNAVLSSPAHKVKVSLRSPLILPRVAVIDPELMISMPPAVTAATGMDAFTQLVEPFVCNKANPVTDGFCREGLSRISLSLRMAYDHGDNLPAREEMALAALFGGLALTNAGLGAVHGLAGPLGGMLGTPHGVLCARLISPVTAVNIQALTDRDSNNPALARYRDICTLLHGSRRSDFAALVDWIDTIVEAMRIPRLAEFGLKESRFPEIVQQARRASSMQANPVVLEDGEIIRVLECAI